MSYSQLISQRLWNLPEKAELESTREQDFIDDIVQKSHIERELLANLEGIRTVFDGGAGSGRFSILLARQGIHVVHFDISQPMLDKARELAALAGVKQNMTFVLGVLEDLSMFGDGQFDMVISFDAPISYTWPNQEKVIRELVRIAGKRFMISVSSRLGTLPYFANPLQKNQFLLDVSSSNSWVRWCLENKQEMVNNFRFDKHSSEEFLKHGLNGEGEEEIRQYENGETPWPITYHFMPDELTHILQGCGVHDIELAGPGAYARTIPNEILVKLMNDSQQKRDFLDFCYQYDKNPFVCGMGKDNLFAKGKIGPE